MATTSKYALRYPTAASVPNVPQDIQNLATDVETTLTPVSYTLTASTGFTNDTAAAYGAPTARLMPWGEVRLSGMVRRVAQQAATADAGMIYQFTEVLSTQVRLAAGQNRLIGTGQTPSGACSIWLLSTNNFLGFSFAGSTTVYNTASWYIALDSLSYWK